MNRLFLLSCIIIFYSSCSIGGLRADYKAGKAVAEDFGGAGFSISSHKEAGQGGKDYEFIMNFDLDVVENQLSPSFVCSRMAYLFRQKLPEEKRNFRNIKCIMKDDDGRQVSQSFTSSELEDIEDYYTHYKKINKLVANKAYSQFYNLCHATLSEASTENELLEHHHQMDQMYGDVDSSYVYGFSRRTIDNEEHTQVYLLHGGQFRKGGEMGFAVGLTREGMNIVSFQYFAPVDHENSMQSSDL